MQGWSKPMSPEAVVLADIHDLWTDDKSPPYPRPWNKPKSTAVGRGTRLTPEQFHERWAELSERAELRRLASLAPDSLVGASGHDQGDDPSDDGPAEQQVDPEDGA